MIRPINVLPIGRLLAHGIPWARSGPLTGALGRQLSALDRRRRLCQQQREIQSGVVDCLAIPPYPLRPRPPA